MQDSIFTKIIKGEVPCHKVYEDDQTLAFLDIHPSVPGHTLVIPKQQVESIWDLEPADYTALMATVKKLGTHLRQVLPQQHVGIKVVGIDVPHTHVHLVPFNTASEYQRPNDMTSEPDHEALAKMAEKIRLT